MTNPEEGEHGAHTPPPHPQRPKGILKNSYRNSPPVSPSVEKDMSDKQITIENTNKNAGHRRSSSATSRPRGYSRATSHADGDEDMEPSQRLKWDEANLYLTEQERTSTMKITEPKTPYAQHYEPSEDEDEDMLDGEPSQRDEIPGLSLGEPEEEVPERPAATDRKPSKVHVHDDDATASHDAEHEYAGMSAEEREKHRKFEQLRKKHYEMRDAAKLLGHMDDIPPEEDDDETAPPMPTINGAKVKAVD
ncbi:uncharacterized protein B0I36DRAFT_362263 [Microdochium trichocladiopsis]|uniref:Glc8 protein n=1 Tax=Microdochium trichocladiopsis TaxID=1682393 RepID=A0A9P8Y9U1_9PEZI|nr:uncharacterized protein B0I36DRAFT_362263 [Microdochium trichocladiopsis]KAH7033618.1 hypothetical protein B0I36DRAFT_362263 [Microdochium trichocladiopsis]